MLPFTVALRPGEPIVEQVVYAVTRAIATGQLRTADAFPSVRALSHELKINPNTAHRIVAVLTEQGLLDVRPGVGTVIATPEPAAPRPAAWYWRAMRSAWWSRPGSPACCCQISCRRFAGIGRERSHRVRVTR